MKLLHAIIVAGLALSVSSWCCLPPQAPEEIEALKELQNQVDSILPSIVSLTGIQEPWPVRVDLLSRADLGTFFETTVKLEYPNDELKKRGRCFALIGLLPPGYDMENGFITILKEQAGAVYDPRSETLIGIRDLAPEERRSINDRMILSHELTHALQDRIIDFVAQSEKGLENIDYEYALRAVIEGMASTVMMAHARNLPYSNLPDMRVFWRSLLPQAGGGALGRAPRYVAEYLISPYAEGGAFIQAWQRANPEEALGGLLNRIPASSEQVLHFEKYARGDTPSDIDLSGIHDSLPEQWNLLYANTLGEFELLVLFQTHERTRTNAAALAAGWDGCRFEAYEDVNGDLILIGSSAWDSENEAEEFLEGFVTVLGECRPTGDYGVVRTSVYVAFVVGTADTNLRAALLESLSPRG